MGGLEPSSNQAGSGEQFKRGEKYISPGGTNVPKTVVAVEKLTLSKFAEISSR
jgi:hypothetical protein